MKEKEQEIDALHVRMLTISEVAHLLYIHPNTVRLWSKIGVLKSYRIGKRGDYRFNPAHIESFIRGDGDSLD